MPNPRPPKAASRNRASFSVLAITAALVDRARDGVTRIARQVLPSGEETKPGRRRRARTPRARAKRADAKRATATPAASVASKKKRSDPRSKTRATGAARRKR